MIGNVLIATFIAVALMDQSSAYTWDEYNNLTAECESYTRMNPHHTEKAYTACVIGRIGIINENGEFNSTRMEEFVKTLHEETEDRTLVIKHLNKCGNAVTGQSKEERVNNYRDCMNTKRELMGRLRSKKTQSI